MRVVIEARALVVSMGVRVYVQELISGLLALPKNEDEYIILASRALTSDLLAPAKKVVVPLKHELLLALWLSWQVPRALRPLAPDIVHFTKAAVPRRLPYPSVVTIYDVIPLLLPSSQARAARLYWPNALRHAAAASQHILTISEQSKADIVNYLQVQPEKITVTPLAVDKEHFRPRDKELAKERVRQLAGIKAPYILCVATLEPRKNIPALARALAKIKETVPHHLILIAKDGWQADYLKQEIAAAGLNDRLHIVPPVAYADLPYFYVAADLFVWPSVYEGWGLPPQEAMACGTPVIVSNGGSLPEVVGKAGIIVPFTVSDLPRRVHDQDFENQLAMSMRDVLTSSSTHDAMRNRGLAQVERFSWQHVVEKTHQAYQEVYESRLSK